MFLRLCMLSVRGPSRRGADAAGAGRAGAGADSARSRGRWHGTTVTWWPAWPGRGRSVAGWRASPPPPHQPGTPPSLLARCRLGSARLGSLAGLNLVSGDFSRALGAKRPAFLQVRPAYAAPPVSRSRSAATTRYHREVAGSTNSARKRRARRSRNAVRLRTICRPLPS